jgi:hypothetical protein
MVKGDVNEAGVGFRLASMKKGDCQTMKINTKITKLNSGSDRVYQVCFFARALLTLHNMNHIYPAAHKPISSHRYAN